jgi:serine/threonine protein phosphatase PrpC
MGGYEGGQLASRVVVETLTDFFQRMTQDTDPGFDDMPDGTRSPIEDRMDMAIRRAHRELHGHALPGLEDMGSTVAALLVRDNRALVAHVGDSRVYRLRGDQLQQVTRDHSLLADISPTAREGTAALQGALGHVLTRAISLRTPSEPDMEVHTVHPGDRFLLCSDGVTDVLRDDILAEVLRETELGLAPGRLVDLAYEAGSQDNLTALIVDIKDS